MFVLVFCGIIAEFFFALSTNWHRFVAGFHAGHGFDGTSARSPTQREEAAETGLGVRKLPPDEDEMRSGDTLHQLQKPAVAPISDAFAPPPFAADATARSGGLARGAPTAPAIFDGPTYITAATSHHASSITERSTPGSESRLVESLIEQVRRLELQLFEARGGLQSSTDGSRGVSELGADVEGDRESEDLRENGDGRPSALRGTTAKSRFLGPSHWMNATELFPHMIRLIRQVENDKSCEMAVALEKCKSVARAIKASRVPPFLAVRSEMMPDRPLADDLVNKYLNTFETVYRVLHVPSFRADYERYWADPSAASNQVFAILAQLCMAIGTSFRDDVAALRSMALRWIYEAQVWLAAPREKSRMTIQGLQIMCLLHFARHVGGLGGDLAWIGAGSLLRQAMYCGLHIDPRRAAGGVSVLRAEMRRRIWAAVLEINLQSSIDAGGPPLLSLQDYDTLPPADLDDEDLRDDIDHPDAARTSGAGRFTQTSVQIAIFKSFPQRLAIAKAVNSMLPRMPYPDLIRTSTELSSVCQALHQELARFPHDSQGKTGASGFQRCMAAMMVHRFFFALHTPLLMSSFQNPAYYFSRKVCVDTALKFCGLADLSLPGPASPSEGATDFVRLVSIAAGPYGITVFQATLIVAVELMARKEERRKQGSTVALGEQELRTILESSLAWMDRRIRNGETNVKGATFHAALLAQVDAFDKGLEGRAAQEAITNSAVQQLAVSYEILRGLAAGDASPVQPDAPAAAASFGFGLYETDLTDSVLQDWEDLGRFDILASDKVSMDLAPDRRREAGRLNAPCCQHHLVAAHHTQYLTDEEIEQFLDDLDHNGDGLIDYDEVEQRLDAAHDELFPPATDKGPGLGSGYGFLDSIWRRRQGATGSDHDSSSVEAKPQTDIRHQFLRSIIGSDARRIPRAEFADRVREWKIPSLSLEQRVGGDYARKMSWWRRIRAYWAVHGPEMLFLALVISMQVAFAVWQLVKYADGGEDGEYVRAFGWGVVLAKTTAGALYPTLFFLVLSMSRYCSTFLRNSYYLSRFINWDLSQSFHIKMSITAVSLATLHTIGHLTGTFNNGSKVDNDPYVDEVIGDDDGQQRYYTTFLGSLPGWTGLAALSVFYALGIMSSPPVRRLNYEVFQLGHLLIYPLLGLLYAHGSDGLLQYPMLGYWLAFPTLMVVSERVIRLVVGFHRIPASMRVLDGETVEITATLPRSRLWGYRAGQYVLLQVPKLSFFQWHPFTVSVCVGTRIQLHIKTDGNWTRQLRGLAGKSGQAEIEVGVNGPFGAPAQRFYDFSHSIVVGSGIGVTPFSGILSDLQARDNAHHGGPGHVLDGKYMYSSELGRVSVLRVKDRRQARQKPSLNVFVPPGPPPKFAPDYRRVDFHWTVRERNCLLWMADLLNDVSRSQQWHRRHDHEGTAHLDIRINTHVTQKRSDIVHHVYCWLLEMYRTDLHPESPLTHLLNPTHLGRPDFVSILDQHYEDMLCFQASKRAEREQQRASDASAAGPATGKEAPKIKKKGAQSHEKLPDKEEPEELKIGVFFCGTPVVGEILADRCRALTIRGQQEGTKIEYYFMSEVFS
ncbi:hypothetical protein B0T16DRAFT_445635 [Cercophora newfieldiana]|uniref:Uncharacterized protein n=1 Tax=Cercophora newfieldiana TaxID=92897 RepID=A0AA39YCY1_9PEZI|nr:hypothetical protein B0T16DRAFT_445635 [Cercophora newfieldiana]